MEHLDRQFSELEQEMDELEQKMSNYELPDSLAGKISDRFWNTFCEWNGLRKLEQKFIGTDGYTGRALFNYEYRHYLRDCTVAQRKAVHDEWLNRGLSLDGQSPQHHKIVQDITCQS